MLVTALEYALLVQEAVARECGSLRWGDFKPRLAEAVVEHLAPLQLRYQEVTHDPAVLEQVRAHTSAAGAMSCK